MPETSSILRVALFAGMAEAVGRRRLELSWKGGSVDDVRRAVVAMYPTLEPLVSKSAIAIGDRYAASDEPIPAGSDVAIIPPVSGG